MLAPRCQNIHDLGAANAAALADYGVTAAKLTELQTAIDAFADAAAKPRAAISSRAAKTATLPQLFKQADAILTDRMDALLEMFAATNPDFVATYQSARVIVNAQTITTQLKGKVTAQTDGSPIPDALVTVSEASQSTQTDPNGDYLIKPLANGKYTVTVTKPGFNDFKKVGVEVKLGQVNNLDAELTQT